MIVNRQYNNKKKTKTNKQTDTQTNNNDGLIHPSISPCPINQKEWTESIISSSLYPTRLDSTIILLPLPDDLGILSSLHSSDTIFVPLPPLPPPSPLSSNLFFGCWWLSVWLAPWTDFAPILPGQNRTGGPVPWSEDRKRALTDYPKAITLLICRGACPFITITLFHQLRSARWGLTLVQTKWRPAITGLI